MSMALLAPGAGGKADRSPDRAVHAVQKETEQHN